MAIISSYTIGTPTLDDYLIGTDDPGGQGPTKNFTLQSIINLVSGTLGDNNFYLSGISSNSSTGAITFTVTGGTNQTLTLGTAAFKATTHFALATDLTTHINDSTQPHSLDSIVGAQSLAVTKLQGITTNGTSGQLLASNGLGGLTFVSDQDENDNYFLSAVTRPDSSSNNVQFTISGGGSNVTSNIFGEAAFLSKSDIRTDVKNNLVYSASDFSFLGDLAEKDAVDSGDILDSAVINARIADNTIEESKLKISNTEVAGYVLTSDGAGGFTWVLNSAANYFLNNITRDATTNVVTFAIGGGGTDVTFTFGGAAFANIGTGTGDVAAASHTHVLSEITDAGALAGKNTAATSDIANNAVTLAKLSDSSATNGQILSVNSSGNLEFINASAVAVPTARLLPTSIGNNNSAVTGKGPQVLRVNSGETAVEFVDLEVQKDEFDTGNSPSAGKFLGIDISGALQWLDVGTASIGTDAITPAKVSFVENTLSIAAGKILVANSLGTKFDSVAMSGDITIASTGATTIQNNAVETAMIATGAVNNDKIADDAVDADKIADGAIVTAGIADVQVTTPKIANDSVTYEKLAAEFTTKAVGSTISDGGSMSINFTQFGVFEATMPGSGSSGITLTFSNADIGMTKVIILNAPSGSTYGGAVAFNQDTGTATLKRLSSDDIVKTANAINYIQVTCIAKSGNDRTYIYTVGQAQ